MAFEKFWSSLSECLKAYFFLPGPASTSAQAEPSMPSGRAHALGVGSPGLHPSHQRKHCIYGYKFQRCECLCFHFPLFCCCSCCEAWSCSNASWSQTRGSFYFSPSIAGTITVHDHTQLASVHSFFSLRNKDLSLLSEVVSLLIGLTGRAVFSLALGPPLLFCLEASFISW